VNRYGKGKAYYTSAETSEPLLDWLYGQIAEEEGISPGIDAPEGVVVRKISEKETLYVNTTSKVKEVMLEQPGKGVLKGESFTEKLVLAPFDGELIVCK
jgi:beta-galactosidase